MPVSGEIACKPDHTCNRRPRRAKPHNTLSMSAIPQQHLSSAVSSDAATHSKNALQQYVSDASPQLQHHSELDSNAPTVYNHNMPSNGPYGQLLDPPRSAMASATVETTQQQQSSMLVQSAALSAASTSDVPLPVIHTIKTIMALE